MDELVNKLGPDGFVAWKVTERKLEQIAVWAGGSVDLAQPPQGVFIPTLEGPVLARIGSIVIRHTRTGRFEIDEDAQTIQQLESNIQATEDLLRSDVMFATEGFESEEDLQAHNQRKPSETRGVPVDVRAMRLKSAGIDNDGLGHIILGPAETTLG